MVTNQINKKSRKTLLLLLICCFVAVLIGLVFIYAASSVFAQEKKGDGAFFVKRQLIGALVGFAGAVLLSRIPFVYLKRITIPFFAVTLVCTAATILPGIGVKIHGAARWIRLPGIVFQPSELLKYAALLCMALVLSRYEGVDRFVVRRYGLMLGVIVAAAAVLLLQPDFGMAVTIAMTGFCLLFIAYNDWRYVLLLALAALPVAGFLVYKAPYRLKRLLVFLDPWADPQGAGFQIIQSLIAIGSGGVTGLGLGNSRQKFFYLPMQHTDFIFSIIAEEIGLLGGIALIFLFILITYLGIRLSWQVQDAYARYLVLGFTLITSLQAIINCAVAIGMFPTKGIGLPFISYGNSSLVCAIAYLGIIARAVHEP